MSKSRTKAPISGSKGKKVFVGLSGGVDSAVSAALLKEQGCDVTGVFIKVWSPDFLPCTWRDERRDAMRVAAHLGIPFLFFDFSEAYKKGVADYMVSEYKAGRTPNPDVMCNREVKFGAFWHEAKEMGADFIATGHYARNEKGKLKEGKDAEKDQSYFLWTLTPEDLKHTLFPVGDLEKREVRKLAEKFSLPVAEKKDSQGICFLGDVSLEEFLPHFMSIHAGNVIDTSGNIIGRHKGAIYYTCGERHGFEIIDKTSESKPYYVVGKNMETNTITVSNDEREIAEASPRKAALGNINWIQKPKSENLTARIRYRGAKVPVTIADNLVEFKTPQKGLSAGQSIVFYDGDICLGGAIMEDAAR